MFGPTGAAAVEGIYTKQYIARYSFALPISLLALCVSPVGFPCSPGHCLLGLVLAGLHGFNTVCLVIRCNVSVKRGHIASFLGGMSLVAAHPQGNFAVIAVFLPIE